MSDTNATGQVKPTLLIINSASPSNPNAPTIFPRYIKLKAGTGATFTSATDYCYTIRCDNQAAKYTSGGSIITPYNSNTNVSAASVALIYAGALVTLAQAAGGRLLYNGQIQGQSRWLRTCGYSPSAIPPRPAIYSVHTGLKALSIALGPVGIAPGWNMQLDLFGTANAGTYAAEIEIGYAERVSGL